MLAASAEADSESLDPAPDRVATPSLEPYTRGSLESRTWTSQVPGHVIEAQGSVGQASCERNGGKPDGNLVEEGSGPSPAHGMDEASACTEGDSSSGIGEEYQKVEFAVLYWHKNSGYYYDPVSITRH